jgi:hypothetical protein
MRLSFWGYLFFLILVQSVNAQTVNIAQYNILSYTNNPSADSQTIANFLCQSWYGRNATTYQVQTVGVTSYQTYCSSVTSNCPYSPWTGWTTGSYGGQPFVYNLPILTSVTCAGTCYAYVGRCGDSSITVGSWFYDYYNGAASSASLTACQQRVYQWAAYCGTAAWTDFVDYNGNQTVTFASP